MKLQNQTFNGSKVKPRSLASLQFSNEKSQDCGERRNRFMHADENTDNRNLLNKDLKNWGGGTERHGDAVGTSRYLSCEGAEISGEKDDINTYRKRKINGSDCEILLNSD